MIRTYNHNTEGYYTCTCTCIYNVHEIAGLHVYIHSQSVLCVNDQSLLLHVCTHVHVHEKNYCGGARQANETAAVLSLLALISREYT